MDFNIRFEINVYSQEVLDIPFIGDIEFSSLNVINSMLDIFGSGPTEIESSVYSTYITFMW